MLGDLGGGGVWGREGAVAIYENPGFPVSKAGVSQSLDLQNGTLMRGLIPFGSTSCSKQFGWANVARVSPPHTFPLHEPPFRRRANREVQTVN